MFFRILDPARRPERTRRAARRRTLIALEGLESRRVLSTFTWNAAGAASWSTPGSWLKDGVATSSLPGTFDDVVFDGADGDATVTTSASVKSITVGTGYTGTIALADAGVTLKSTEAFTQAAGTFDAGAGTLSSGKGLTVSGGSFLPGTGTLVLTTGGSGAIDAAGVQFNNVTINYGTHHINVGAGLRVKGALTINGAQQLTGVIYADGDVTTTQAGMYSATAASKILIGGNGNRTLTGVGAGSLPNVEIDRTGGTLTIAGDIQVRGNWTHVKGAVAAASSTVTFKVQGTVDSNTMAFGNVAIDAAEHHFYVKRLNVGGDLTLRSLQSLNYAGGAGSGAITVGRNLTSNDGAIAGLVDITLTGAAHATIAAVGGVGDFPDGGIIIQKGSGANVVADVTQPLDGPLSLVGMNSLTGQFQVAGNVSTRTGSASGNADGSPVLFFKGNKAQTLTYARTTSGDARLPGLMFDKTGGSITLAKAAGGSPSALPDALTVTGGWIVTATNVPAIDLIGHDVKFILSGGMGSRTIDTGNSAGFQNVELATGSGSTVTAAKMIVNGTLTISNLGSISGKINARGDVATSDPSVTSAPAVPIFGDVDLSAGTILFDGAGAQLLTATNGGQVPSVIINKTTGTLGFGADPIGVTGDWTYTKGTADVAGSTISFQGFGSRTVNAGAGPRMAFNNVDIFKGSGDTLTVANLLDVNGDLTIRSVGAINASLGAITVGRNLVSTDTSVGGSADITMDSAQDAIIQGGDFPNGGVLIHKGSGANVAASVLQPLDGPLSLAGISALTGELQAGRNVVTRSISLSGNADGTPVLILKGNQAQTITYHRLTNPNNGSIQDARLPGVRFDKSGGSVSFAKGAGALTPEALVVTSSWIVAPGNAAAINLTGHNIVFTLAGGYGHRTIDTGNSAGFQNVEINAGSGATVQIDAMVVNGKLTIGSASQINGAAIRARGDVATKAGGSSIGGSSRIRFEGGTDQSLTSEVAEGRILGVEIAKSTGTLTIGASNVLAVTGNWTYTSGTVSAAGSTIKFIGGDKLISSGAMIFGNVIVAVGSANFVDIDGVALVAGTLAGANFDSTTGKVRTGKFVQA